METEPSRGKEMEMLTAHTTTHSSLKGGVSRSLHREHVGLEGHAAAHMRNASGVSICTFRFSEARKLSFEPVKQVN